MKTQIEPGELTQRIRREARRHEHAAFPPATGSESANVQDALPMPAAPVLTIVPSTGLSCETLLALIGNMVDRARGKTTVHGSVPKLLRPLWRNQGGYNDIVLESLARFRETNRSLMADNDQLKLHIQRQTEWMQAAEHRFTRMEKRLDEMQRQIGAVESPESH